MTKLHAVFFPGWRMLLCILAAPMLAAASDPVTNVPVAPADIVMFGDSTTALRPGKIKSVYTARVGEALAQVDPTLRVANAGVGGNTTGDARARFERDVLACRPRIVVMQFGINDACVRIYKKPPETESRVSLADYEANLRAMIGQAREHGIKVVLMTTNPLRWTDELRGYYGRAPYHPEEVDGFESPFLSKYNAVVRRLAAELGVPLVDINAVFMAASAKTNQPVEHWLLDGMHPNDDGHQLVTDALLPVLRRLLGEGASS